MSEEIPTNLHSPRVVLEVRADESEAKELWHEYAARLKRKGLTKRYGVSLESVRDTRYRVTVWQVVLIDRCAKKGRERRDKG